MTTLLDHYHFLCQNEHLKEDAAQREAIQKLENLTRCLQQRPSRLLFWKRPLPIKGLYIYGDVGRGKSMLMDLFYKHLKGVTKRRYHFHEFMQMIHNEVKILMDTEGSSDTHPMATIASKLASQSRLICFDEFHIKDITDAMLLKRLMDFLWQEGVTIVATSNHLPEELYKDGYQRKLVLPFLKKLAKKLDLYSLSGLTDYRQLFMNEKERYFFTDDADSESNLALIFDHLRQGTPIKKHTLTIKKRDWVLPKTAGGVAWFTFDEICGQSLSANDYLELSTMSHTVLISHIPQLDDESLDRLKRFITLIDVLYDQGINFSASGSVEFIQLYIGTQEQELFERTISRLTEMTRR